MRLNLALPVKVTVLLLDANARTARIGLKILVARTLELGVVLAIRAGVQQKLLLIGRACRLLQVTAVLALWVCLMKFLTWLRRIGRTRGLTLAALLCGLFRWTVVIPLVRCLVNLVVTDLRMTSCALVRYIRLVPLHRLVVRAVVSLRLVLVSMTAGDPLLSLKDSGARPLVVVCTTIPVAGIDLAKETCETLWRVMRVVLVDLLQFRMMPNILGGKFVVVAMLVKRDVARGSYLVGPSIMALFVVSVGVTP